MVESTTGYTFTPCEIFDLPWHRHRIEGTNSFYCLIRKTQAKWGEQNCQCPEAKWRQQDSNPGSPGRRSYALTHSSTHAHSMVPVCAVTTRVLLFESLHDSRPMLGAGSSSGVELFQVFMGTRLWQDGGRPAVNSS